MICSIIWVSSGELIDSSRFIRNVPMRAMTHSLITTLAAIMVFGVRVAAPGRDYPAISGEAAATGNSFLGLKAGEEREVAGVKLCWCPAGRFRMGSPRGEPERHSDEEAQVEVVLTKGFWIGKHEV